MNKILVTFVGVLSALLVFVGFNAQSNAPQTLGSVVMGNEYFASSTSQTSFVGATLIKRGPGGTLGSIVIASTSGAYRTGAGSFYGIYDSGTTATSTASSTVVLIPAGTAAGTYTFDVALKAGLVVDIPSDFNGGYVITFR